jgi:hypothetical protein
VAPPRQITLFGFEYFVVWTPMNRVDFLEKGEELIDVVIRLPVHDIP